MQWLVMLKHTCKRQINAEKTDHLQQADHKFPSIRDSTHKKICRERVNSEIHKCPEPSLACRLVESCSTEKERRGENSTEQEKQSFGPLHWAAHGLATDPSQQK